MAAAITTVGPLTVAPGNTVTLDGTGLSGGAGAKVELLGQGFDGSLTTLVVGPVFAGDGSSVVFQIPDGALTGSIRVTASDASTAAIPMRVVSQYVQAREFIGQGVPTNTLAPGDLDVILQDASLYADTWTGQKNGLRLMQTFETHPWRNSPLNNSRRLWPFRRPIISVDQFIVIISNMQQATFQPTDIIINADMNYIELLSYAVAAYLELGVISNVGVVANIVKLVITAGYPSLNYPPALGAAVKMIATELLIRRNIGAGGYAGVSQVKKGNQALGFVGEAFAIPLPAKEMLRPFMFRRLA
jgi:hypothetical protein